MKDPLFVNMERAIIFSKRFASINNTMRRKEKEIARMTAYIAKVGEAGAGAEYMAEYAQELRLWDELKVKRDSLKQ